MGVCGMCVYAVCVCLSLSLNGNELTLTLSPLTPSLYPLYPDGRCTRMCDPCAVHDLRAVGFTKSFRKYK